MNWMDRLNERAHLMGRMLDTLGARERLPGDMCLGKEIRQAVEKCECCEHTDACVTWLNSHADGARVPFKDCPNADLIGALVDD